MLNMHMMREWLKAERIVAQNKIEIMREKKAFGNEYHNLIGRIAMIDAVFGQLKRLEITTKEM